MSSILLDTHVLLWILNESPRLKEIEGLEDFSWWTISPISLLEMKFLNEVGRLSLEWDKLLKQLKKDDRFRIDDVTLESLCESAFALSWTRDPFDRFLVSHSIVTGLPLATRDALILKNFSGVF